jgi:L-lactate dehydrogenase complex protein LldG
MDSKNQILRKVRLALARPQKESHHQHLSSALDVQELFASSAHFDSLVEKFRTEFQRVSGEMTTFRATSELGAALVTLIRSEAYSRVVISRHPICLNLVEPLSKALPDVQILTELIDSENPYERTRLKETIEQTPLAISGADFLIADIGAIVEVSGSQASRQLSLLPTVHLVVATPDQIRANMAEVLDEIRAHYPDRLPGSSLTFITGPSRTADIEKVLIKGVHGPTRLLLFMVENA